MASTRSAASAARLGPQEVLGTPKSAEAEAFYGDIPTLLGFIIRGLIWDIPILIFAYVLFWGPKEAL